MSARFTLILTMVLGFASISTCKAETGSDSLAVEAGFFLNDIHELNLKENFFIVDLWVWLRWDADDAEMLMGKSGYAPFDSLEVVSGLILERMNEFVEERDERIYASARWLVKVKHTFDVSNFPLDSHVLSVRVEDSFYDSSELSFTPDGPNTAISRNIDIPVWRISNETLSEKTFHYETNFGDPDVARDDAYHYSRLSLSWKIYTWIQLRSATPLEWVRGEVR